MANRCPGGNSDGDNRAADSGSLLRGDDTARLKSVIRVNTDATGSQNIEMSMSRKGVSDGSGG